MYNTSTSLIDFTVRENGSQIFEGKIPYSLLSHVTEILGFSKNDRTVTYNIDGNFFTFSGPNGDVNSDGTVDPTHPSRLVYAGVQNAKILEDQFLQDTNALELFQHQLDQEKMVFETSEVQRLTIEAFDNFKEMLIEQKQLTEEQAQLNYAEQLRQDENRIALVRGVALDPTTAVSALQTEFGQTGDVRRQIAAVMADNVEISRLVASSNPMYWTASYEIMSVLGTQSSENRALAQILVDQLPDDSSLKTILKSFGWAN
jgi:hypothetical protein